MATRIDPAVVLSQFAQIDADGSGALTAKEIRTFLKKSLGLTKAEAIAFVAELDQNGDGEVQVDELTAAVYAKSTFKQRARKVLGAYLTIDALVGAVAPPSEERFTDLRCATEVDWDFSPGIHGRACNERRAAMSDGCTINEVERRAMRLASLRSLWRHVDRRAAREGWHDQYGRVLEPNEVTMYDAIAYAIKPATEARQCSLAELVNTKARKPEWFVAHSWGDAVEGVLTSAEQHGRDRGLDANKTPYWLAATAISQWKPGGHVVGSAADSNALLSSSFASAMRCSYGTLLVLDPHAACLSRSWVAFEVHLALSGAVGDSHALDIYTPAKTTYETGSGQTLSCEAVGLLRGYGAVKAVKASAAADLNRRLERLVGATPAPSAAPAGAPAGAPAAAMMSRRDSRRMTVGGNRGGGRGVGGGSSGGPVVDSVGAAMNAEGFVEDIFEKTARESAFPWSLVDACQLANLEGGAASVTADRNAILNLIAENDQGLHSRFPAESHPAYREADRRFAGYVAATSLRRALNQRPLLPDPDHTLFRRLEQEANWARLMRLLGAVAASMLPRLALDLRASEDFSPGPKFFSLVLTSLPPELMHLSLACDVDKCPADLFRSRAALTTLDLSGCGGLQSGVFGTAFRDCDHLFPSLKSLSTLLLTHCRDLDALPSRLWSLPALTKLDVSNCPRLSCLPDKLPPNLNNLILTRSPIATLGSGISELRHLRAIVGLDASLTSLPDLSKFAGRLLDLEACIALYECAPPKGSETGLQQVYRRQPFDPINWLRVVFPWADALLRRGVIIEPPRTGAMGAMPDEQLKAVSEELTSLVEQVQADTARRSMKLAKRYDVQGMLTPTANRERAISVCQAATRKRVSLEELRIEAQRVVRLGGERRGGELSGRARIGARGSEDSAARVVRARLDALDAQLKSALLRSQQAPKANSARPSLPRRASTMPSFKQLPLEGAKTERASVEPQPPAPARRASIVVPEGGASSPRLPMLAPRGNAPPAHYGYTRLDVQIV